MYEDIRDNKEVRCRKPHQCEWCGEKIPRLSKAISRVYKWDGELNSCHQHLECFTAMGESDLDDGFEPCQQDRGKTYSESAANK